jgi:TfoX/Sxy family transcriptional regulator of competence genes
MELLERVRALLPTAVEKRMFGGTGFMVDGALACSVSGRGLLVRVGADEQGGLLAAEGVEPMVMGGRASRGWVHVSPEVLVGDDDLHGWVARGVAAARAAVSPGP